ncbi:DUF6415 family natural product biosynthesis protein [Streptomyces sp. G45]|uniref:DUF6415 family natural product biosynthesis protein n=1 Tax=Streptomyces sp. G45 TaxID=3406627 RepID=UPI003C267BA0
MTPAAGVRHLLEVALAACRTLPPTETTVQVHRDLVAEIQLRLPRAEQAAAAAEDGSPEWHRHQRVIRAARDALDWEGVRPQPGEGPLVAALRVAELGRRLRDLAAYPPREGA